MIAAIPDFGIALPEIVFTGFALILLMVGTFGKERSTGLVSVLSAASCVVAIGLVLMTNTARATSFEGLFVVDRFAGYMKVLVLIGSALSIVMSMGYLAGDYRHDADDLSQRHHLALCRPGAAEPGALCAGRLSPRHGPLG
jgi:NADH-quinone oxidoreductase subunit N